MGRAVGPDGERSRRLWEELTSVPTRRNSVKFATTYAGFEGESNLLMDLYKLAVGTDEHPDGQAVRIHPTLPIYENKEARIFCYWTTSRAYPSKLPSITTVREGPYGPQRFNAFIKTNGYPARTASSSQPPTAPALSRDIPT